MNSECSRLINLYNKADPKNRALMYPKDDCRSVEILKDRYNGNGEMVEGDIKVNVDEKYWFFCKPKTLTTQPECK